VQQLCREVQQLLWTVRATFQQNAAGCDIM